MWRGFPILSDVSIEYVLGLWSLELMCLFLKHVLRSALLIPVPLVIEQSVGSSSCQRILCWQDAVPNAVVITSHWV